MPPPPFVDQRIMPDTTADAATPGGDAEHPQQEAESQDAAATASNDDEHVTESRPHLPSPSGGGASAASEGYRPKTTKEGDLPNISFEPRKPRPLAASLLAGLL